MLNGLGLCTAKTEDDEYYDTVQLDPSVNVFGMVLGGGYGEYPYVDLSAGILDETEYGDYEGEVRTGPSIVLSKVITSDVERPGSVQEVFDKALIPLSVRSIHFHGVLSPMGIEA